MRFLFLSLVLSVFLIVSAQNEYYKGYKVYSVRFLSEEQQDQLSVLKSDEVDFWRNPSVSQDVIGQAMVSPSGVSWFEERLKELGVKKDVVINDVYDFLTEHNGSHSKTLRNHSESDFSFEGYYRYAEILNHISRLNETYYDSTTISLEVVEGGRTEGDRPLVYVKVTSRNNNNVQKPVVVIEGGVIPREWVTIPSALYILDKLLNGDEPALLNEFEWIVIPVLNPDGYEYTHTNLRLWMKNRSTRSPLHQICPGANINRNFDIDWSVSDSSTTPCSHLYAGTSPFSEEESQFVRSILEEYGTRIKLYLSLQNTGGFVSYPWQFEKAASGLFMQHLLLSRKMVAAMNEAYKAGIGSVVSGGRASGSSTDYARNNGVLYTFNIDVIPVGNAGVMVPANEIVNVAEDVWRAVSVAANSANRLR